MLISIAILVTLLLRNVQALVKCNGIVTKLQLCSLHENYNKGVVGTGAEEFQFPLTINSSITLIDIAEFDENKNTITLQVVLSIRWHAATMELESNNNKYVFQFNWSIKRIVYLTDIISRIPRWYQLDQNDQAQIWSPTLQINQAKTIQRTMNFGPTEKDYLWYDNDKSLLDYKQTLKVTIYCTFDFESYPFDSNFCDLTQFASDTATYLQMNPSDLMYKSQKIKDQEQFLHLDQSYFSFDISLERIQPFLLPLTGYNHSSTGMRVHFRRNDMSALIGSYYVPTLIFALMSLLSYSIDSNVVRKIRK